MVQRVLVLSTFLGLASCGDDSSANVVCTSSGDCEEAVEITSAAHLVGPIDYADPPPAGGPHAPCWADYVAYDHEIPDENWVHSLEHGAIVLAYNCPTGCAAELAALEALAAERPRIVLTPYSLMQERFAVVSWGHRLVTDAYDDVAFRAFYDVHFDRAPESVGSGPPSSCPAL